MTWKRWAVAGYCVTTIGATLAAIHAESPIPAMDRASFLVVAVAIVVGPFVGPLYLLGDDLGTMAGGLVLLATLVGMWIWGLPRCATPSRSGAGDRRSTSIPPR